MSIRTIEQQLAGEWEGHSAACDWREKALDEALYIESSNGNSEDIVLREIRRARPGCAAMMIHLDRTRLLRFITEQASHVRALIQGRDLYCDDGSSRSHLYMGWYEFRWRGGTFEAGI